MNRIYHWLIPCFAVFVRSMNTGLKHFSASWITGSSNHRSSNIVDHAQSEQHKAAMLKLRRDQAKSSNKSITSYSPIARSLLGMDDAVKDRMRKKFDICYVMAKERMAFRKYPALHDLESRHGVDLGTAYKTKDSARSFTHYIADTQRQNFVQMLSTAQLYHGWINRCREG